MSDFSLSEIGQIAIPVDDISRATVFYRDVLGMKFLFDAENMAFFDCDGIRLMLAVPESEELDHPASVLYYRVDDIEAAEEELEDRGVVFVASPRKIFETEEQELWMGFFRDSEDNVLALMSEVPKED